MRIITEYLPIGRARPGIRLKEASSVTIHWVGPYPGQSVWAPYYWWRDGIDGRGVEASAHFIVKDDTVLASVPVDEVAWHCGSSGNYTSIGIEVIPLDTEGVFSVQSIETLRALLKTLPEAPLRRHFDWTGKKCPAFYCTNDKWSGLLHELGV
jgi:hypothetical protein